MWNTSFLFELPPGDVGQLHLMLEFIIMQVNKNHCQRINIYLYCVVTFTSLLLLLCDRIRSCPLVEYLVGSESVWRLQMLDVPTGGTCAT